MICRGDSHTDELFCFEGMGPSTNYREQTRDSGTELERVDRPDHVTVPIFSSFQ